MSSKVEFVPISGAFSQDPLCYLLKIDDVNILLDCGSSDEFNVEYITVLEKYYIYKENY